MRKGTTGGGGIRRLWDLVMKFGGEFGGYGDTSFHSADTPSSHPSPRLPSFNANVAGKERTIARGGVVMVGEPTSLMPQFRRPSSTADFFP